MRYEQLLMITVAMAAIACGSSLEDPVSNDEACKQIKQALDLRCTGDDAIGWLNCDYLPGCPNGKVEGKHVKECINKINAAPSCNAALELQCSILKVDCGDPAESFNPAIGFDTVCKQIVDSLNEGPCKDSNADTSECPKLLKCSAGAFNPSDVLTCTTGLAKQSNCDGGRQAVKSCVIQTHYCLN
jgi:hypothetical protein